jgi:hypothetical protein
MNNPEDLFRPELLKHQIHSRQKANGFKGDMALVEARERLTFNKTKHQG